MSYKRKENDVQCKLRAKVFHVRADMVLNKLYKHCFMLRRAVKLSVSDPKTLTYGM